MANLDRLLDTPEYQGIRSSIRAYLIAAKGSKPSPTRRFPPTRLIAAGLHHDTAGAIIAAPLTVAGRTRDTTTVVRTRAVTASRCAGVVRKSTRTGIYDTTSLLRTPTIASTGALRKERYTKTCDALSTMQHMALPA